MKCKVTIQDPIDVQKLTEVQKDFNLLLRYCLGYLTGMDGCTEKNFQLRVLEFKHKYKEEL